MGGELGAWVKKRKGLSKKNAHRHKKQYGEYQQERHKGAGRRQ